MHTLSSSANEPVTNGRLQDFSLYILIYVYISLSLVRRCTLLLHLDLLSFCAIDCVVRVQRYQLVDYYPQCGLDAIYKINLP